MIDASCNERRKRGGVRRRQVDHVLNNIDKGKMNRTWRCLNISLTSHENIEPGI